MLGAAGVLAPGNEEDPALKRSGGQSDPAGAGLNRTRCMQDSLGKAIVTGKFDANTEGLAAIEAGYQRMQAAEAGADDPLNADIAFHLAILRASENPFYAQFQDLVSTALRTSIRFTNRFKGRTASLAQHHDVLNAIKQRQPAVAHAAMETLIADVMALIADAERQA